VYVVAAALVVAVAVAWWLLRNVDRTAQELVTA
jgi:hypothetical protein